MILTRGGGEWVDSSNLLRRPVLRYPISATAAEKPLP